MCGSQKGHNFSIWELHPESLRLLDFYGGAIAVEPADYFAAELQREEGDSGLNKAESSQSARAQLEVFETMAKAVS